MSGASLPLLTRPKILPVQVRINKGLCILQIAGPDGIRAGLLTPAGTDQIRAAYIKLEGLSAFSYDMNRLAVVGSGWSQIDSNQ